MSLLSTGLGALMGHAAGTTAANTSTNNQTYGSSNSGSTTPTYNPLQSGLQGSLAGALSKQLTNGVDTTPMATAGTNAINQTYKGIGDRLSQQLSQRGFGNSGASGTAQLQTELGRAGAVGDLQSQLGSFALQQQQDTLGKALGFGFANPGQSYGSATSGNAYGTSVGPHSPLASSLSALLSQYNAGTAQALSAYNASGGGGGSQTFTGGGYA